MDPFDNPIIYPSFAARAQASLNSSSTWIKVCRTVPAGVEDSSDLKKDPPRRSLMEKEDSTGSFERRHQGGTYEH